MAVSGFHCNLWEVEVCGLALNVGRRSTWDCLCGGSLPFAGVLYKVYVQCILMR
jgi:hypothetical protein